MVAYQHPSELNPLQNYRQASSILRGTSRATNDGWYTSPIDLDYQVHLRIDGNQIDSWIFRSSDKSWTEGPELSEEALLDASKVPAFAEQLVSLAKKAGSNAVGVVLHIADEFATTEIKPELDNPGALGELREKIANEPTAVLDDASLSTEEHSWRLVPYPATGSESIATAVTISRHAAEFVDALRTYGTSKNFPIVTLSVSAPLIALLALPEIKRDQVDRPFLAVLPYPRFTTLAFFNEHGDLLLLRTLQHRGQRRPSNLRHAVSTTAAALEMANPEIFVLPLAGERDPHLSQELKVVFEDCLINEVDWSVTAFADHSHPGIPPEMLVSAKFRDEVDTPVAGSHTFTTLRTEGWATQDFLPVPTPLAETYPSRGEMKLLRASRYLRFALVAIAGLSFMWIGFAMLDMVRRPEWTFNESEAGVVARRIETLQVEKKRIQHWDNLLDDRSKAWVSMEMLARFFPEHSGFLVRTFNHTASPEVLPGQAKLGFVKQWRINGLAREESLEKLANLNTREGISAAFAEIARVTGNEAFRTDLPTRSIVVNVKTLENSGYQPMPPEDSTMSMESSYPFIFDLTITQRFESDDPLAVTASKAP
ncbi:hypothetical protein [Haloferula helveola]|uniref:hypothetical protein n=1 Tax=Haloferula helveola TaxID=490095 RepID=UPI0030CBBC7C